MEFGLDCLGSSFATSRRSQSPAARNRPPLAIARRQTVKPPMPASPTINLRFVTAICFVAAGGGLLFGYDLVVIGGAKPFYEPFFQITDSPWMQGWAMSSALVGCLIGAIMSGLSADRLGRRRLLVLAGILFIVSAIGTSSSFQFQWFNLFRMVGGVAIGLASNLSPMYIAEVAPAKLRGRMVSINQLTIVIGILAAQVVNYLIAEDVSNGASALMIRESWNGMVGWRWMFAAEVIPASGFLLLMFMVPESPRWLIKVGREEEAMRVLSRIGGRDYAQSETESIRRTLTPPSSLPARTTLAQSRVRRLLGLGIFLAVFQQWCGINVIFNYAQEIFAAAGYGVSSIMLNIVITGIVNLLFTFVAMFTVDRFGRRGLMLIGSAGLALIYAALGMCYYTQTQGILTLVLVVGAIAVYAMSLAPVTWVIISEIFPNEVRGSAIGICVSALWLACTALTFTFPILNDRLGPHGTFWLYGSICVVGMFVLHRTQPETAGRSLEEIEQSLE